MKQTDSELRTENDDRHYRRIFVHSPVALFVEDFSKVHDWIDGQRRDGVADIRSLLESSPETLAEVIGLIKIVDVNPAAVALLNASDRAQLLGTLNHETIVSAALPWLLEEIVAVAESRHALRFETAGITFTGQQRHYSVTWVVAPNGGASSVVVAAVDITEQRRREEELASLVESNDLFIAAISHELRTPMTAVLGFAEELRESWRRLSELERVEFMDILVDEASEVAGIIDDLLVAARASGGPFSVREEPVDLAAISRRVLASRSRTQTQEVDASLPMTVALADPLRVRQIVRNLLSNAKRYGGKHIELSTGSFAQKAVLVVRDDGEGIPPNDVDKAFSRYVTLDQDYPGAIGLGLPVARHLAELMGGDLIYVRDGDWSEFRLTLPSPQLP